MHCHVPESNLSKSWNANHETDSDSSIQQKELTTTETDRFSGWLPWSSLGTMKPVPVPYVYIHGLYSSILFLEKLWYQRTSNHQERQCCFSFIKEDYNYMHFLPNVCFTFLRVWRIDGISQNALRNLVRLDDMSLIPFNVMDPTVDPTFSHYHPRQLIILWMTTLIDTP